MKLYENILIGNYLFDLGVRMAKLRPDLPLISVNLLQQTPSDRLLGDVLLANASVCRLIEFKRAGQLTKKETAKLTALRQGLQGSKDQRKFEAVSRQIHWYIQIDEPQVLGEPVVSNACPYLDFSDRPEFIDINQFAASAAEEACLEEPDHTLIPFRDSYIRWVSMLFAQIERKARDSASMQRRKSASSSAFMIAVNKRGEAYWLAVPSIEYIFMNKYELSQALALGIDPDTPKYEQKMDQGYDVGFGF